MKNINLTLESKMCCGCGACFSVCPTNCIEFESGEYLNYPKVNSQKCVDCGVCLRVCPGEKNKLRLLNNKKVDMKSNIKDIRVGYSVDNNMRKNSASGGIITQIAKYMLESNQIQGAILVAQDNENILHNKVTIIRDVEELYKTQGSRYSPASNCAIFKEIISENNDEKYLFVGKPCDIEALAEMEKLNKKIRNKIEFKISIMCHHSPTRKGLLDLFEKKNISQDNIESIKFRGDGWPGNFQVKYKSGETIKIPYFDAWGNYLSKDENSKCMYCENPFPLEADLIVGDAWGEEFNDDKEGISLFITRTEKARNVIDELEKKKLIKCETKSYSDLERYQVNLLKRYREFNLNVLMYKNSHGHKIVMRDYINALKEDPKNLVRYYKRRKYDKNVVENWKYK